MVSRIYTEDRCREVIYAIVSKYFPSFTVLFGYGVDNEKPEQCLIVEIVHAWPVSVDDSYNVLKVARAIKEFNQQHSVMVTTVSLAENVRFI
jgi:hypothetical protein